MNIFERSHALCTGFDDYARTVERGALLHSVLAHFEIAAVFIEWFQKLIIVGLRPVNGPPRF
jgi:hypothetical protein